MALFTEKSRKSELKAEIEIVTDFLGEYKNLQKLKILRNSAQK